MVERATDAGPTFTNRLNRGVQDFRKDARGGFSSNGRAPVSISSRPHQSSKRRCARHPRPARSAPAPASADVRMIQLRDHPRFPSNRSRNCRSDAGSGQDHDRHSAIQARVLRLVDRPHSLYADRGDDLVRTEAIARYEFYDGVIVALPFPVALEPVRVVADLIEHHRLWRRYDF